MANISAVISNIRKIMRQDRGISGDAQRLEQLGWMLFLKIIDDKDQELEILHDNYVSVIPEKFQWRNWATDSEGITGDELLEFVDSNQENNPGLFSNDDNLSKQLINAGEKVEEKVWRMPLHKNYDKLIDSKIADIQNINYSGGAGSITAAQFLQRFITNKTPWAHLDIAGMAFSKKAANINPSGATGFGVRLLNKFVEENYE